MESGTVSRDQFILQILDGVHAPLKVDQGHDFVLQQLADQDYLKNKVDIGAQFAVHRGMSDVANATAVMELFNGSQDSIFDAVTAIDNFYMDSLDPNDGEFLLQIVGVFDNPFAT
ncbi:hypothetical protein [Marivita sp.]|uniref:hypothetical protein n=1 Tax=Marivita sp. TaxID=2003365 RepID=UPI003F6ABEF4